MLVLQQFKKTVNETVIEQLTRSGRPPCMFFALHGESYDIVRQVLSVEQFTLTEGGEPAMGVEICRDIMAEPGMVFSCLVLPQFVVEFMENGVHHQYPLSYIYDRKGELVTAIKNAYTQADNGQVQIFQVLSMVFEYPVGTETVAQGPPTPIHTPRRYFAAGLEFLQQPPSKVENVFGATWQLIRLRPDQLRIGVEFAFSTESGTEYGQPLKPMLGRLLRGGLLVENTRFAGSNPWTHTLQESLAILEGVSSAQPLPDVHGK